jgi:hypothetical protein
VKDVNFGENVNLIHIGLVSTVMAVLSDTALSPLHEAGVTCIASY